MPQLPPDPEQENENRADWAATALDMFQMTTSTDDEDKLSDLLCDLRHWADRHPEFGTWEYNLARAMRNYEEETSE